MGWWQVIAECVYASAWQQMLYVALVIYGDTSNKRYRYFNIVLKLMFLQYKSYSNLV